MSKCERCVMPLHVPKEICVSCKDNPIYANYPKQSYFIEYWPTCPLGYHDCVNDPAYIKCYHPEWYKELYGDKTPLEASKECKEIIDRDSSGRCYDKEDK